MGFRSFLSRVQGVFLPEQCRMCLLSSTKRCLATGALCEPCYLSLPGLQTHRCLQCAEPALQSNSNVNNLPFVCATCQYWHPAFDATITCCDYAAPVNDWIAQLKYHNDSGMANVLACLVAYSLKSTAASIPNHRPIDVVIPAPISRQRLITRGYNQAAIMASTVAHHTQSRLVLGLINKPKETAAQATLQADHRADNLISAFAVNRSHAQFAAVAGAHVAIVDDVMTTGATLEALAHLLKTQCGVARVTNLVFARTAPPITLES